MYSHQETRQFSYTRAQLYALVADIERYPDFLPWVKALRIRQRSDYQLKADLEIGFKFYRESFRCEVSLDPAKKHIGVIYLDGPFQFLESEWRFSDQGDFSDQVRGEEKSTSQTQVTFSIRFAFKSRMLDRLLGPVFNEAVKRITQAFEERAAALYGQSQAT